MNKKFIVWLFITAIVILISIWVFSSNISEPKESLLSGTAINMIFIAIPSFIIWSIITLIWISKKQSIIKNQNLKSVAITLFIILATYVYFEFMKSILPL